MASVVLSTESYTWWVNTVKEEEITFLLYNRFNSEEPDRLYLGRTDEVPIDGTLPFKILTHGNYEDPLFWYNGAISAYLEKEDVNVITVDWREHNFNGQLAQIYGASQIASFIYRLIAELKESLDVPLENVHIIGHSYGAHVAGLVGTCE